MKINKQVWQISKLITFIYLDSFIFYYINQYLDFFSMKLLAQYVLFVIDELTSFAIPVSFFSLIFFIRKSRLFMGLLVIYLT
jgi:Golgi nucleoside diphosphatase